MGEREIYLEKLAKSIKNKDKDVKFVSLPKQKDKILIVNEESKKMIKKLKKDKNGARETGEKDFQNL